MKLSKAKYRKAPSGRRIKPIERSERRTGVEVAGNDETAPKTESRAILAMRFIKNAVLLISAGWHPTELGLWMRRTKWDTGSITETYNFQTACEKQLGVKWNKTKKGKK